jgi:hypothetical protein
LSRDNLSKKFVATDKEIMQESWWVGIMIVQYMESLDLLSELNVQETEFTAKPLLKQSAWFVGKSFQNKSACH